MFLCSKASISRNDWVTRAALLAIALPHLLKQQFQRRSKVVCDDLKPQSMTYITHSSFPHQKIKRNAVVSLQLTSFLSWGWGQPESGWPGWAWGAQKTGGICCQHLGPLFAWKQSLLFLFDLFCPTFRLSFGYFCGLFRHVGVRWLWLKLSGGNWKSRVAEGAPVKFLFRGSWSSFQLPRLREPDVSGNVSMLRFQVRANLQMECEERLQEVSWTACCWGVSSWAIDHRMGCTRLDAWHSRSRRAGNMPWHCSRRGVSPKKGVFASNPKPQVQ